MSSLIKVLEQYSKPNGIKFISCPSCGQKGLYKVRWRYERCRYCGLYRILLPGQDF